MSGNPHSDPDTRWRTVVIYQKGHHVELGERSKLILYFDFWGCLRADECVKRELNMLAVAVSFFSVTYFCHMLLFLGLVSAVLGGSRP